jgi:AcrR family transcriptional regulator
MKARARSARRVPRARRSAPASKREATRHRLRERALALFQEHGVEGTTMRDIARAAGLSLGAAYYHFPSKEALVFAYYEDNQRDIEEIAARATGSVRERLGAIFHGKLASIRPQRAMLAAIVQRLVDPGDPLSAFSAATRAVRERSIDVLREVLATGGVAPEAASLAASALWLAMLAMMLVYIHDTSPGERRTHGLVDDALDMVIALLPLLGTPVGAAMVGRITASLARADIPLA